MARLEDQARVREYRNYVTDMLRYIVPNGLNIERYADLFNPHPLETRTPEEIKRNIINKLREDGDGPT